ncbi:MAG: DUF1700 domain-containing protein [Lachnospiraceae bacterium]|nr:DUF1700 domain-containing protein [Lachnospiraceae bacterium]
MDKFLNEYLEQVEKCLKPLAVSERIDIVKEIKSEMVELQSEGKTAEEIIERLGKPKELAKAYLGDLISQNNYFSWNRVLAVCAFYSLAGFSGLFVIPTLGIVAPVFIFCAIITPILGAIKLIDSLVNLGFPYASYIGFATITNPLAVFVLSILTGVVLYLIGRGSWKLLIYYIKAISKTKRHLSV